MDKWEHCVIAYEEAGIGRLRRVVYFAGSSLPNDIRREVIAEKVKVGDHGDVLRTVDLPVMLRLGSEGWELVHVTDNHWLYFKRRVGS